MAKDKGHLVITDDPTNDIAISAEGVYKSFRLPHNRQSSIKGALVNLVSRGDRTFETQEVLKDVSFDIKKGEFFGIVGRNGSGKSTLLKMLAGIYTPTAGKVVVNGSLTPFIELGVGFNPELTGRENVYLNGALLGFNDKEVDDMYEDIVLFAELEKFMDQKLKNYSSGMQVRLAFSIAIRAKSDIMLIDEVLAVGDLDFQQKCYKYFDALKEMERTIILVTHDMGAVRRFCDRALLVSNGKVIDIGTPEDVSLQYERNNLQKTRKTTLKRAPKDGVTVTLKNSNNESVESVESGHPIKIHISWADRNVTDIGVLVYKNSELVFAVNSVRTKSKSIKQNSTTVSLKMLIGNGIYTVKVGLFEGSKVPIGIYGNETLTVYGAPMQNIKGDSIEGICDLPIEWR